MHNKLYQFLLSMLLASVLFSGCNKESFIENAGNFSGGGTDPGYNTGSITFWSSNPTVTICSNGLQISVNGTYKGSLTDYSAVSINCGAIGSKALTVTLPEGTHSYTANGTGMFCPKYSGSFKINKGQCVTFELIK